MLRSSTSSFQVKLWVDYVSSGTLNSTHGLTDLYPSLLLSSVTACLYYWHVIMPDLRRRGNYKMRRGVCLSVKDQGHQTN